MATSPTVLASASSYKETTFKPAKSSIFPLLLTAALSIIATLFGAGGAVYYLVRSGRFPASGSAAHNVQPASPVSTHLMVLEPLLVNLSNTDGNSYLRVTLALRVTGAAQRKDSQRQEKRNDDMITNDTVASARDTLLTVLGRHTSAELLAADGKENLKSELKAALFKNNPELNMELTMTSMDPMVGSSELLKLNKIDLATADVTVPWIANIEQHPAWHTISQLQVALRVGVVLHHFKLRDLVGMREGQVFESLSSAAEDVPLKIGQVQLGWCEFEVLEQRMLLRLTRLG